MAEFTIQVENLNLFIIALTTNRLLKKSTYWQKIIHVLASPDIVTLDHIRWDRPSI
jgi:hypothetical protein